MGSPPWARLASLGLLLLLAGLSLAQAGQLVIKNAERKVGFEWVPAADLPSATPCPDFGGTMRTPRAAQPRAHCPSQINLKSQVVKVTDSLEVASSGGKSDLVIVCYPARLAARQARLKVRGCAARSQAVRAKGRGSFGTAN